MGNFPVPTTFLKNGPSSASFSFIFGHFKQTIQVNVKNVHLVSSAGIRTQKTSCI